MLDFIRGEGSKTGGNGIWCRTRGGGGYRSGYARVLHPLQGFGPQRAAADHARAGRGPVLLELRTYRLRAHSMFDAQLYRDKSEVEEWRQRGPLTTLTTRLKVAGLMTEDDFQRLQHEADAEVQAAVQFSADAPWEPVADLTRHVYAEEVRS